MASVDFWTRRPGLCTWQVMARAQFRGMLIAASLAAQSSCGAGSQELPRATEPRAAVAAPRDARSPLPGRMERLAKEAPVLPTPQDAWAEYIAGEQAMRAGFEQRFPLHGVAFHMLAQVFSEPSEAAVVVGYLRRGTRFRAAKVSRRTCDGGAWYGLSTGGFVCTGRGFLVGDAPQSFEPAPKPPALQDALPYAYAKNIAHHALQYWRVPSLAEQKQAQAVLAAAPSLLLPASAAGAVLAAGEPPTPAPAPEIALPDYTRMAMEPGFYVSVDREQRADDAGTLLAHEPGCAADTDESPSPAECAQEARGFVRTVRGAYVATDSLTDVQLAPAPGVVLGPGLELPLGIVYRGSAKTLVRDPLSGAFAAQAKLPRYASVALTGARVQHERHAYQEASSGMLVAEPNLRIAQRASRPPLVPRRARWIHVNRASQTLVAYEGDRAVFATLVATGKSGYDTPAGVFRIHAKHVSSTMDGLVGSEEAYSIEDVPWTMYFQGSYALHAAFWHDRFGAVRSHGCVNLSPEDARWLFRWTTPVLPAGWHGVTSTKQEPGTFVVIE